MNEFILSKLKTSSRCGSKTFETSNMERFEKIVNDPFSDIIPLVISELIAVAKLQLY